VEGPANAPAVVCVHGSECSRKQWIFPTPPKDVRIIAISRPGYGESDDIDPGKFEYEMMADIAKAVLDQLSIDKFHVMGHSGGGPYAIAIKALLSPRCQRCILLAGESEYASKPAIDPVGVRCCGPNGCFGKCGIVLCCFFPLGMRIAFGGCCVCCTSYKPSVLQKDVPQKLLESFNEPGDIEQLGENGKEYCAFMIKVMEDAHQNGRKPSGLIIDVWAPKKGWQFADKLSDGTFSGADVEIWAGELDKTVPMNVSEHNHSLIPGSTLHVAEGIGHCGVAYPLMVAQRFASLAEAPQQSQMRA